MGLGDLFLVEQSASGEGLCRYLANDIEARNNLLGLAQPDFLLTDILKSSAPRTCERESIPIHLGTVSSIDTILGQFFRLDYLISEFKRLVRRARTVVFQLAEVAVPRALFQGVLDRIGQLCPASG